MTAISFDCPTCSSTYRVPAEKTGQRTKCPRCGEVLVVPGPKLFSEPSAQSPSFAEGHASSTGGHPRRWRPPVWAGVAGTLCGLCLCGWLSLPRSSEAVAGPPVETAAQPDPRDERASLVERELADARLRLARVEQERTAEHARKVDAEARDSATRQCEAALGTFRQRAAELPELDRKMRLAAVEFDRQSLADLVERSEDPEDRSRPAVRDFYARRAAMVEQGRATVAETLGRLKAAVRSATTDPRHPAEVRAKYSAIGEQEAAALDRQTGEPYPDPVQPYREVVERVRAAKARVRQLKASVNTAGKDRRPVAIDTMNRSLSGPRASVAGDQLVLEFDIAPDRWIETVAVKWRNRIEVCPVVAPLLVRLFDADGNYLTHFVTKESYTPVAAEFDYWQKAVVKRNETLDGRVLLLQPRGNRLVYGVNKRDLNFTGTVEVGFYDLDRAFGFSP